LFFSCEIFKHKAIVKKGAIFEEGFMLYWALVFFVVSLVAGIFGFGGIASATAGIAQILFYVFLVFFIVTLIAGLAGGGSRRDLP
jgi:uncharacterized membrane protein YtjA (UPF0391 family)